MKENLQRLKFDTEIVNEDFFHYKSSDLFDCILIDAPCSASGLMQKKPEILIRDKEKNIKKLIDKQQRMLQKSEQLLKIGVILFTVFAQYIQVKAHTRLKIF